MSDDTPSVDPADAFGVGGHGWDAETLRAVSPRQQSARDVAAALRRLAVSLETTGASVAELDELAARLGELADGVPEGTAAAPGDGSADDPTFVYQAHRCGNAARSSVGPIRWHCRWR